MKKTKRFLCMALAFVMMISSFVTVVSADEAEKTRFSDVTSDMSYDNAVSTLNIMGIINGYPDGTFGPDRNVTRAEFTAMLMRTLNFGTMGSTYATDLPFVDVADSDTSINWAIPNINTAYGMGIVNGYEDSTFRPNANVAYEEAIKMIVCTLGYGDGVDVSVSPWYANYITIANQTGITKNASGLGTTETPATRACIAQLLYDSLEIKIVENGNRTNKTILSDYLGYTKCRGIIYSNNETSLASSDIYMRDEEIQIYSREESSYDYEVHTYITSDADLKNYIGHEIEFYYVEDGSGNRILMFSVLQGSETIMINASNVDMRESDDNQIIYYNSLDDSKEKRATLAPDNVVIYNGKLYGSDAQESSFAEVVGDGKFPEVGSLTLIDSNRDGRYDVIDMTAYEIYYVSSKDTANYKIVDNLVRAIAEPSDKTLTLNTLTDRRLSIVNKEGEEIEFSSISVGNIICYAESNENGGNSIRRAVVLNDKVSGTVTEKIAGRSVTIDKKEYVYSKAAPWMIGGEGALEEPQTQDAGTYFFDINGDLVAYTKNVTTETVKYGYIVGYSEERDSFDGNVTFRVLNTSGTFEDYGTYKNTTVDGDTCPTGADVVDALVLTADNGLSGKQAVQQLVKYTTRSVDGKNVFNKIITATAVEKGGEIVSDKLTTLANVTADDPMSFTGSSKVLTKDGARINIGSSIVISVPVDRTAYREFRKSTVSSSFKNGLDYNVEIFDVSATNAPKVVVVYGADNSEEVNSLSPVYVLTGMNESKNTQEDSIMYRATGYKATHEKIGGSFTEWISDETGSFADELEKGDIFRAGTDRYGYTLVEEEYMIYDMDGTNEFGIKFDPVEEAATNADQKLDMFKAEFVAILASVVARDEATLTIAAEELSADDEYDITSAISFNVDDFEDAVVLVYDESGRELAVNEGDYISAIAGLTSYAENATPSKILIYMSEGKIRLLCVLPQ